MNAQRLKTLTDDLFDLTTRAFSTEATGNGKIAIKFNREFDGDRFSGGSVEAAEFVKHMNAAVKAFHALRVDNLQVHIKQETQA